MQKIFVFLLLAGYVVYTTACEHEIFIHIPSENDQKPSLEASIDFIANLVQKESLSIEHARIIVEHVSPQEQRSRYIKRLENTLKLALVKR